MARELQKWIPTKFGRFPRSFFDMWPFSEALPALEESFESEATGLTLSEDDNNIYVEAQMPGLNSKDIEVTLDQGFLSIQGQKSEEEEDKKKKFYRKASSSFSYRISLPSQIDETQTPEATYKNGIMKITFAKGKKEKSKRINIKG